MIRAKTFKCYSRHVEFRAYLVNGLSVGVLATEAVPAVAREITTALGCEYDALVPLFKVSCNRAGLYLSYFHEPTSVGATVTALVKAGWKESKSN